MTDSRILDIVLRRMIMRKVEGELYDAFPGLSKTTPFALFKDPNLRPLFVFFFLFLFLLYVHSF